MDAFCAILNVIEHLLYEISIELDSYYVSNYQWNQCIVCNNNWIGCMLCNINDIKPILCNI